MLCFPELLFNAVRIKVEFLLLSVCSASELVAKAFTEKIETQKFQLPLLHIHVKLGSVALLTEQRERLGYRSIE